MIFYLYLNYQDRLHHMHTGMLVDVYQLNAATEGATIEVKTLQESLKRWPITSEGKDRTQRMLQAIFFKKPKYFLFHVHYCNRM